MLQFRVEVNIRSYVEMFSVVASLASSVKVGSDRVLQWGVVKKNKN